MKTGPNIVGVAALVGERARADILAALMSGRALTAGELANAADITKQTASTHLAKLVDRKLLALEKQGRHRYFRLADDDVAQMLENLMGIAQRVGSVRLQTGPSEPALRRARVCYDHLAGEIGVRIFERLQAMKVLRVVGDSAETTSRAVEFFLEFGIDIAALQGERRPLCRACLDWSVRRHHLAGALGAALLQCYFGRGWARRQNDSRIVTFTPSGAKALREHFAVDV